MTPTPRRRVPPPPAGCSDKGPGPWHAPTHRSDSWSTCTAPPPWCPRPLRPLRPGAAFSRSPDPFTVPGPRRRGAPAAGPCPCAAETPTLGVPARCGDARRVSHRRPGDQGHCGGLRTRGLDAVGAPLHRGQGTGWIGGAAESFKVPQVRPRVAGCATWHHLNPRPAGPARACPVRHWRARSQIPLRGLAATAGRG